VNYKHRARQNVILELGYFIGTLGRERVAAIYQQDVEIPSDYGGVLFIPHDEAGSWQLQLAKEIKAAGVKIDLNKL
jgi:predicted nucleotide-binding protein